MSDAMMQQDQKVKNLLIFLASKMGLLQQGVVRAQARGVEDDLEKIK